jgi:hypothetical protein
MKATPYVREQDPSYIRMVAQSKCDHYWSEWEGHPRMFAGYEHRSCSKCHLGEDR